MKAPLEATDKDYDIIFQATWFEVRKSEKLHNCWGTSYVKDEGLVLELLSCR